MLRKTGFDVLESAVSKGFDKIAATDTSHVSDPDLALYKQMTPEVMNVIAETYGPNNLLRYIQTMEAKLMKSQKGA